MRLELAHGENCGVARYGGLRSRPLLIALAIVVGLMIGGAFAVLPATSDAKPKGAKKGVFYNDFPGGSGSVAGGRYNRDARLAKKPKSLTWGTQSGYNNKRYIQNITWESWGGAVAQDSGFDTESKRDVSIRLSRPKWCGPYKMYQVAWISPSRFDGEARDVAVKCRVVGVYRNQNGHYYAAPKPGWVDAGKSPKYYASAHKWRRWGTFRALASGYIYSKVKVSMWRPIWCKRAGLVAYSRSRVAGLGLPRVRLSLGV